MKPKVFSICLILVALLLFHGNSVANPKRALKGVAIVSYSAGSETLVGGELCKIDENGLATSLQFVANQSAKLKLLPQNEAFSRAVTLAEKAAEIWKELSASGKLEDMIAARENDKYLAAKKAADDLNFLPLLLFVVTPLELTGGCAAVVEATLSAYFDDTQMDHTRRTLHHPSITIWKQGSYFVGPKRTFAEQVTGHVEQLMKEFVNDWTASQELPD
jgi:hypothetical protein